MRPVVNHETAKTGTMLLHQGNLCARQYTFRVRDSVAMRTSTYSLEKG